MTQALGFIVSADTSSLLASMVNAGQVTDREAKRMQRALEYVSQQLKTVQSSQQAANQAVASSVTAQNAALQEMRKHRAEANQLTQAYRQLPMQITDVVTSLSSGMPVWMVAIQQGGQIKDSFGGIVPAFRAVLDLLTPMRVLMGGAAAGAALFAFEIYQGSQAAEKFRAAMAMTNSAAGLTLDSFRAMADAAATVTGATSLMGRETMQALVATGRFSRENMEAAAQASLLYQKATGDTADQVAKDMAGMMDGVLKWAQTHNRSMHFMSAADMDRVRSLESQGKAHEAASVVIEQYNSHLQGTRKELGWIEKSYKDVATAASNWLAKIQNLGAPDTIGDAVGRESKRLERMRQEMAEYARAGGSGPALVSAFPKWLYTDKSEMQAAIDAQAALVARLQQSATMGEEMAARRSEFVKEQEKQELLTSKQYTDAQAALRLADGARQMAVLKASLDERQRVLEQAHAREEVSDSAYRERYFSNERERLSAQLRMAQQAVAIEAGRKTENPTDVLQRDTAVAGAKARAAEAQAELNKLDAEYRQGNAQTYKSLRDEIAKYAEGTSQMEIHARKLGEGEKWAADQIKKAGDAVRGLTDAQREELTTAARREGERRDRETSLVALREWVQKQEEAVAMTKAETAALGMTSDALRLVRLETGILSSAQDLALKNPERANEIYAKYITAVQNAKKAEQERLEKSRSFDTGASGALANWVNDATNQAKYAEKMINGSFQRMEDSIIDFAKTGKLSFSSLFSFMAEEYLRNIVRMNMASVVSPASGGGLLSGLFSLGSSLLGLPASAGAVLGATGDFARMDRGTPHANGLDYVPYDGYHAILHKGERVQTALQARGGDSGTSGGPSISIGAGQVINIGQGVNRSEVVAGIRQANAESEARIMRRLRQQGVAA